MPWSSRDRVAIAKYRQVVPHVPGHHVRQRADGDRLVVAVPARLATAAPRDGATSGGWRGAARRTRRRARASGTPAKWPCGVHVTSSKPGSETASKRLNVSARYANTRSPSHTCPSSSRTDHLPGAYAKVSCDGRRAPAAYRSPEPARLEDVEARVLRHQRHVLAEVLRIFADCGSHAADGSTPPAQGTDTTPQADCPLSPWPSPCASRDRRSTRRSTARWP